MRKLLLLAALLLWIPTVSLAATEPPGTYQEWMQDHEAWNRSAKIKSLADGTVIRDLGPSLKNPFPNKAACVEGMEPDTVAIYLWLSQQGVPIEGIDVDVICEPAGEGI